MSYSASSSKPSMNWIPLSSPGAQDADACYVIDTRKIQDNIQTIKTMSANIDKLIKANSLYETEVSNYQKELRIYMDNAKKTAQETQILLKRFSVITGGSLHEKNQRRMMHDKLSKSYQISLKELEMVAQNCLMAENSKNMSQSENEIENREPILHSVNISPTECIQVPSNVNTNVVSENFDDYYNNTFPVNNNSKYEMLLNKHNNNNNAFTTAKNSIIYSLHMGNRADKEVIYPSSPKQSNLEDLELNEDLDIHRSKLREMCLVPVSINSTDLEEELMKQRIEGIHQIEQDIRGINRLYTELAWHVNQQTEGIDDIESRMLESANFANEAVREITVTRNRQRKRFKKLFFFICILVLVGLLVFIIFLRSIQSGKE